MSGWDARFDQEEYLFGTQPAAFLKAQAGVLAPSSSVLCVADGEGRNSVYLASLGHDVTAFDASGVGLKKGAQAGAGQWRPCRLPSQRGRGLGLVTGL